MEEESSQFTVAQSHYQVAHFYNTIEQQMLPCQQAMMLEQALRFERLLMPKGARESGSTGVTITWDDPARLQAYITQLQEAAVALTTQNRALRAAHAEIAARVRALVGVELALDATRWSSAIADIRTRFAEEERRVANAANMRPWAIHWDKQLCKIVQLQFDAAAQNVNAIGGSIGAQLVLRDQQLALRPSLHEIKAKYYDNLQRFFALPAALKSIQRFNQVGWLRLVIGWQVLLSLQPDVTSSPFASVPLANAEKFASIYADAERHIDELASLERRYAEWTWLSRLNIEELVEEHCSTAEDWERQLDAHKALTRRADELSR